MQTVEARELPSDFQIMQFSTILLAISSLALVSYSANKSEAAESRLIRRADDIRLTITLHPLYNILDDTLVTNLALPIDIRSDRPEVGFNLLLDTGSDKQSVPYSIYSVLVSTPPRLTFILVGSSLT